MILFLFLFISIYRGYRILPTYSYFYKKPLFRSTRSTNCNIISETNNTHTNISTEQISKFVEYMKLKTFDYNEIDNWDSGEIEWEV